MLLYVTVYPKARCHYGVTRLHSVRLPKLPNFEVYLSVDHYLQIKLNGIPGV